MLARYSPMAVATIVASRLAWIGERLTVLNVSGRFDERNTEKATRPDGI
jgi:hypothetical protein